MAPGMKAGAGKQNTLQKKHIQLKQKYNMKKNISIMQTALIATMLLTGASGCEKVDDPEAAIVGRWELIADGHDEDHLESFKQSDKSYMEFLPDGRYMHFSASQNMLTEYSYKIDDSRLYLYFSPVYPESKRIWKYKFLNRNKIKLIYSEGIIEAINMYPAYTQIHKRTK
ncbi:MAG: hypothetical protein LBK07_07435 [Tannerella sp.]|jgi:hypothetical protein|nr:hypothetical protein [Tannerella sp.]